jgi:hypothetical protein
LPFSDICFYKSGKNPENHLIRENGKQIGLQLPDLITTNMNFSRRKKSATLLKGLLRGKPGKRN